MNKIKKLSLCATLTALAIALSIIESAIPLAAVIPLPGVKLGLANVVTLFAIYVIGAPYALAITICRVGLVFLATGNVTALIMSFFGGILSLFIMVIAQKYCKKIFSIIGVSVLGAAFHNIGQIIAACLIMRSFSVVYYLPFLLISAIITGILTGAAALGAVHGVHR